MHEENGGLILTGLRSETCNPRDIVSNTADWAALDEEQAMDLLFDSDILLDNDPPDDASNDVSDHKLQSIVRDDLGRDDVLMDVVSTLICLRRSTSTEYPS
jgi:hypothetical protein